ncbi:DUF1128 domain-containing protein [Ornithinibacillus sp. 4-3]|uniref:DUF1128 domain-containing protein n=1 Tax=Ornithinibacillus sp. 4-3 TaxID=3231488 RepID=A0AB39HWI4_9BACI
MNLTEVSQENLEFILKDMTNKLAVANHALFDPDDYDINKYDELKDLYDMILRKGKLSIMETQAFVDELSSMRKK